MEQGLAMTGEKNQELDFCLSGYDYDLPEALIAQNPAVPRDSSRLLVVNTPQGGEGIYSQHYFFRDLPDILQPGDLLIMNNTKVIPARLYGRKSTGAKVEVLLLEEKKYNCWLALVKPGRRFKIGSQIIFDLPDGENQATEIIATVMSGDGATGGRLLEFEIPDGKPLIQVLGMLGEVPLPPYIHDSQASDEQYQTVYAENLGAVAAPTAGLHFTHELLARLAEKQINYAYVTLHVGIGTFRPVEVEDITTHQMHGEWIDVPAATVEQIKLTQAAGGRIIAVGTTAVRSLEGAAVSGELQPFCGKTNMFIYPGYQWRVVDGLITNFHLPRSSLLMLVSALIGRTNLLKIYQEAIALQYRFYSFGDAMLILPEGGS
ncbi:tRNA preQ1(34) S-adenosylmethionine ribosyltransferase-isomerase QueA [Calothrix sp. PCC 6303]|uniref:tRNA preQ1(34) S-adenosylmethionine ribosyltransferase-isomerase QueA n=1 Tax=Calothrix sp. PCC 6303 TaxID=1170562 RepID=UPI0002A01C6A|nr:tRNA preQ1(34) S-adenosylmethionine ribosyltransferase-isomerase QueA [Calothrix sp. PCC 6303]AFZ01098.1 S-adenosylmethionine--tRNA ribosyltransferase-isomerase [Calothrix sp. PCC 6303]